MKKQKIKICALTANRADFSRIETILQAVNKHPKLELQLVVMGSHLLDKTGRTIEEVKRKGFKVDYAIQMEVEGGNPVSMAKSVGLGMVELATILNHLRPDVVIAPVDRFESLAMGATPALMNIHVAHIQGGEVTGTIDESIRHALTKLSHLHFAATRKSCERIIKMGEPEETVFNVGCPGTDLLLQTKKLTGKQTLQKLNADLIKVRKGNEELDVNKPFLLMVQHPVTTEFGGASDQMTATMEALQKFDHQVVVLWPNIDAGSDDISKILRKYTTNKDHGAKLKIFKHIPTEIFVNLLRHATAMVGNSSSGIREACYFGTPVVNVGSRQSARERGSNVTDVGYDRIKIADAIKKQIDHGKYPIEMIYGDGTAGEQIANILATVKLPDIQKKITY